MEALKTFFQPIIYAIPKIGVMDCIDILIVAFLIYKLIGFLRGTTAIRVATVIIVLLLTTKITDWANLNSLNYILSKVLELGFIALVIVFQPELRRFLIYIGSKNLSGTLFRKDEHTEMKELIEKVVNACEMLSKDKIGALIVFERGAQLDGFYKSGTMLDAHVSVQLLRSLFFPKAALHDGAVIIRQGRVSTAGCVLPLTENTHISSDLGTRHRAGIGISEVSDAVVVIVSEETGTISVAVGGMLKRHLSPQMLHRILTNELIAGGGVENESGILLKIRKLLGVGRGNNEKT